jgi:TatD DNase family protein
MKKLIDSHCHLNFEEDFDLHTVRKLMNEADVEAAIVVGIDLASSQKALDMTCSWMFPAVGIHPQSSDFSDTEKEWETLEKLIQDSRCIAIGETGLDFFHQGIEKKIQAQRFLRHIELAQHYRKPLIVHCRQAENDVSDFLKQYARDTRGVLHCWSGDIFLAKTALDLGWYISLAGNLTFKNAHRLQEATRQLDTQSFLIESDAPFLSPHPHRGKKNHPALVIHTLRKLAELKAFDENEMKNLTRHNTRELFSLKLEE